eukprot:GEMP01059903.1.p1 GENE.GEMP01059903.1~~GEMP01059903.1.p1  ORF type:complete len:423 (+),score=98.95 GEMP01059903.1:33-1271(+)
MAQYIHLSPAEGEDDALVEVAHYFVQLLREKDPKKAETFEQEFTGSYGDKAADFNSILRLFFSHIDMLFSLPEDKLKDIEGCFSLLISLLQFLDSQESTVQLSREMTDVLVKHVNYPNLRLKLLMAMYNYFLPSFPSRYPIFRQILTFSFEVKLFDQVLPYLAQLESWKQDWDLSKESERDLYYVVQNNLRSLGKLELAYTFLQKYLNLFEVATPNEYASKECEGGALQVIKDSCSLPKVFEVDSIMSLNAVKALQSKHSKLLEMMNIFREGRSPKVLEDFRSNNPKVFTDYDIDYDALLEKIRILALASLAKDKQELSLEEAAQALGRNIDEVETWVVKAISDGVIEGRIDQLQKVIKVKSTLFRTFGPTEWKALDGKLKNWVSNIKVLQTLQSQTTGMSNVSAAAASAAS